MGRTNKQWRHVIGLGVEVSAPNAEEASRRIEDARDALQARFSGSEIYPPRISGSASRIAGSPTFKHFLLIDRPSEVDIFDDDVALTERNLNSAINQSDPSRTVRVEGAAVSLVRLLRQSIEAGWIPSHGSIVEAIGSLESALSRQREDQFDTKA